MEERALTLDETPVPAPEEEVPLAYRLLKGFLHLHLLLIVLASLTNGLLPMRRQTVVFTSGADDLLPRFAVWRAIDFFLYGPLVLAENLRGARVLWYSDSTRAEVLAVLKEPWVDNVVFVGHGSFSGFAAADGGVESRHLLSYRIPKKRGYLLQLTCAVRLDASPSLCEAVLTSPFSSRCIRPDGEVTVAHNYVSAWLHFFHAVAHRLRGASPIS